MIKIKFNNELKFREVEFSKEGSNIITLKGDIIENNSGFKTFRLNGQPLGDFSNFDTIYKVGDDFIQFSNDGSVWTEPTKDIIVLVSWNDAGDAEGLRPEEINLVINGEDVVLDAATGFQKNYHGLKADEDIVVESAEEVEGYDIQINGTTAIYTHEYVDPTPSLEDRISDLEAAVCELVELMEG